MTNILIPGSQLYKYKLLSQIGSGSFGNVWLAHDDSIDKDVAVKVIDSSDGSIVNNLYEAKVGSKLNHSNLVKVHYADVVSYGGKDLVIIAMDYHSKGSVIGRLNACNFIPIPEAIKYIIDVLRGLEFLHEENMYHNDIKPNNILVGTSGEGILTDYGITCISEKNQPARPRQFYELHAAPLTISSNQINVKTDVYQVGLTLFRLVNGIGVLELKYHQMGRESYWRNIVDGKIVSSNDFSPFVPNNLKRVINKAIVNDPDNRYQTALEFRRALERLSYCGFWTVDENGKYVGHDKKNEYCFEIINQGNRKFELIAFKKNKSSERMTRMSKYSIKNISNKGVRGKCQKFMQDVVMGI